MRIIGGTHKGHPIARPPGVITRPTMDRVRESIFNILTHATWSENVNLIEGALVLDAFAGSGALALEALSRGASFAHLFDKSVRALATVRENVWKLGEENKTKLYKVDATSPPKTRKPASLIFLDPPFGKDLATRSLKALHRAGWISQESCIVIEIASRETMELPDEFEILSHKIYGTAQVFFLRINQC